MTEIESENDGELPNLRLNPIIDILKVDIKSKLQDAITAKEEDRMRNRLNSLRAEVEELERFLNNNGYDTAIKLLKTKLAILNDDTLKGKHVIVDFWANWCGPCKIIGDFIRRQERRHPGELAVIQVNIDKKTGRGLYMEYASKFGIDRIPYVILFDKQGRFVGKIIGARTEELRDMLKSVGIS